MSALLRRLAVVGLVLLLVALAAPGAQAAEPRTGENVTIPSTETVNDDVYLLGTTVTVDGTVRGDVVALAQRVIVNGTVEGDLWAGASSVTVNGRVGGSVRTGAYSVVFGPRAQVGKDVLSGAFSIVADPGSQVRGDMWAGSYQARLEGEVGEDYRGGHVALELLGTVRGDVVVEMDAAATDEPFNPTMFMPMMPGVTEVPTITPGLRVGERAQIGGALRYTAPAPIVIAPGRVQGVVEHSVNEAARQARVEVAAQERAASAPLNRLLGFVRHLVTLLLVGGLLLWLLPRFTQRSADMVAAQPLVAGGIGLVALFGIPAVMLLILVLAIAFAFAFGAATLGGLAWTSATVGLLADSGLFLAFLAAVNWVSKIVVGLAVGQLALARTASSAAASRVWPFVLGVTLVAVLLAVLDIVPFVGGFVSLLVTLLGLGALVMALWRGWRPAPVAPAAPASIPA